jgi:hypothetical protein
LNSSNEKSKYASSTRIASRKTPSARPDGFADRDVRDVHAVVLLETVRELP